MANAKADAVWPEGNDVERGMRTSAGREREKGRRRRASSLAGPFATADAIAIATTPRPAALRARLFPAAAKPAAMSSQRRE